MARALPSKAKTQREAERAHSAPSNERLDHRRHEYIDAKEYDPFLIEMYGAPATDRIYHPEKYPSDCPNPRDDQAGFAAWLAKGKENA